MLLFMLGVLIFLNTFYVNNIHAANINTPGKICPPTYMIQPCTCERPISENSYISITCHQIFNQDILRNVLNQTKDYPFSTINFLESSFSYLPIELFNVEFLNDIYLNRSSINSLFEKLPPENNSVKAIRLQLTKVMRGIEWKYFSNFKKLEMILIDHSAIIKEIGQEFQNNIAKTLRWFIAYGTSVNKLSDDCFSEYENLIQIDISRGKITELKRNMFPSKIEAFIFAFHRIANIPDDLFDNMPHLKFVVLRDNLITTLNERPFGKIRELEGFSIMSNPIRCGCDMFWLIKSNKPQKFDGTCEEPQHMEGKDIKDLTVTDFPQC